MELANISDLLNYAKSQRCEFMTIFNQQNDPYCLMKQFCKSLNQQTKIAIISVILIYLGGSLLTGWFLSKGYKTFAKMCFKSEFVFIRIFGCNLMQKKNRIYYFHWVKDRLTMLLISALLLCLIYFW